MKTAGVSWLSLAVLVAACGAPPAERLTLGAAAPEFSLLALDGGRLASRELAGKVVVLNFWATWCQPCLKEIPELQEISAAGRVEVVGIALDEEGARAVRPFVERHGIGYTVLLGDQEVFRRFDGFAIPYTLVLDAAGKVVNVYRGPTTRAEVERDLETLEATTGEAAA